MSHAAAGLFESRLSDLQIVNRGKVRDLYAVDDKHLLIVATDRLSAFDVVLPDPIPEKGAVLTDLSNFWFGKTRHIVPNHQAEISLDDVIANRGERLAVARQAMVVRKLTPLPIEAIVRGYLIGSGWKDYSRHGSVCGIPLAPGLRQADKLPQTLFTPSTKAEVGEHDENIDFATAANLVGRERAEQVRDASIALYEFARDHARTRGIIIADTKFEFGIDADDTLVLIDEVLTPDSSRFWPVDGYSPGSSPPSYDKQYVRDYLEELGWNKRPPAPKLPQDIIGRTSAKYKEARERLTS